MFLSATFAFRMKLAARHREGQLTSPPGSLAPQLEAIWADARYTMRERKRIVCLLWSGLDPGDPARRRMAFELLAWLRTRIPASSPYAYDGDEMLACSEGGRAFNPYQ